MKDKATPIVDDYLKSLDGIEMAEPNDAFYSRLISRLEDEAIEETTWVFPLKPRWMIASLAVFLVINIFVLIQNNSSPKHQQSATIESFANDYDQNINSSY